MPQTVPYKAVKEKKAASGQATNGESSIEAGQTTLDGRKPTLNGTNGFANHPATAAMEDEDDPNAQLEMESRGAGARRSAGSAGGISGKEYSQDVEMH